MAASTDQSTRRIIICDSPGKNKPHFGDVFPSLEGVATAIGENGTDQITAEKSDRLEIAFLEEVSDAPVSTRQKYRYYFDTHLLGGDGDGSERDPWPDVPTALKGLADLHRDGAIAPKIGEEIVLERREIFTSTYLERKKVFRENVAKYIFMLMALALVTPVVAILSYLTFKAWPALSWGFLTLNPKDFMTAGGIWAPLIGTFFLVLLSLIVAAPIGILAGVYLNEYAKDNWLTRFDQSGGR